MDYAGESVKTFLDLEGSSQPNEFKKGTFALEIFEKNMKL